MTIETATEKDLELERFVEHLDNWLRQQPEWADILAAPRTTRKRVATLIANAITTIPAREEQVFNRGLRRKLLRAMQGGET